MPEYQRAADGDQRGEVEPGVVGVGSGVGTSINNLQILVKIES